MKTEREQNQALNLGLVLHDLTLSRWYWKLVRLHYVLEAECLVKGFPNGLVGNLKHLKL